MDVATAAKQNEKVKSPDLANILNKIIELGKQNISLEKRNWHEICLATAGIRWNKFLIFFPCHFSAKSHPIAQLTLIMPLLRVIWRTALATLQSETCALYWPFQVLGAIFTLDPSGHLILAKWPWKFCFASLCTVGNSVFTFLFS